MNEHEIADRLRSTASGVAATPDLVEVEQVAGRERGRRRIATGVAAAMLVAGAGGVGFGLGRSAAGNDAGSTASPAATTEPVGVAASTGDTQPDDPSDHSDRPDDVVADSDESSDTPVVAPTTAAFDEQLATIVPEASADPALTSSYYEPYGQPLEYISERTISSGYRVRVLRGPSWGEPEWGVGDEWAPAPFCWATGELRVTIDGPDVVDVTGSGWYTELYDGLEATVSEAGIADGHPMRVVVVQAAEGVSEVAVTWSDGGSDRAPVVGGFAALVVDGDSAYDTDLDFALDVTDASGTTTVLRSDLDHNSDPAYRAACQPPPPPLPDPGEQPADPDAARAAISERFDLLFTREVARDDKPDDLLDDWTGVAEAISAVDEGDFATSAGSAKHQIDELVFTGPTSAWFRYSIDTDAGFFGERYGTAERIGDVWQFPRALICQDLSLAGGGCEPFVDEIRPPSWDEYYGTDCWIEEDGSEMCVDAQLHEGVPVP